ncbi:MAG TPA: hypothetical protein VGJ05_06385 [Fimbriiglobus sp.]|jgi:hypothetical protein
MKKTHVEEFVDNSDNMRLFQQERAIYEITTHLEECMRVMSISRSDLAKRLGKSRGWVTQLLDGDANKTIRTVADAFAVIGLEFKAYSKPIQISNTDPGSITSNSSPLPVEVSFSPSGEASFKFGLPSNTKVVVSQLVA